MNRAAEPVSTPPTGVAASDARRERASRVTQTVALVVPCALMAAQTGVAALFGFVAAAMLVVFSRHARPRLLSGAEEAAAQIVLLGLTVGLFTLAVRGAGESASFGRYLAVAMLALAVPRAAFVPTSSARIFTLAFGLLALMGMARAVERFPFGLATLVYLVASLMSVLQADAGFGPLLRHKRGLLLPFAVAVSLTGAFMGLLGWGLPAAEPAVSEYLEPYLGEPGTSTSGYSDGEVRLGGVREIQTSDEVMMRLEGAPVSLLRGQVYLQYMAGTWVPASTIGPRVTVDASGGLAFEAFGSHDASGPSAAAESVTVEPSASLGRTVFLPAEAVRVEDLPPDTVGDAFGRVRLPPDAELGRYRFRVGRGFQVSGAPPEPAETLPNLTQAVWLEPIAQDWGLDEPGLDAREVLGRIQRRLGAFDYTLTFDEPPLGRRDPVRDFLERSQAGHCELFAAAMVLLARQSGVPARFVTGFRAVEENPVGGYTVVRGRDAHAWVEAYVDGGWQTYDPTPTAGLAEVRGEGAGYLAQRLDVLLRALGRAFRRLQNLGAGELAGVTVAVVLLSALFVFVRRRAQRQLVREAASVSFEPLVALEAWLDEHHQVRRPVGRTLAAQAERLRADGHPVAAELLEDCADLRYGGRGDETSLRRRISAYLREGEGPAAGAQR